MNQQPFEQMPQSRTSFFYIFLFIIVVILIAGGAGVGAYWYLSEPVEPPEEEPKDEPAEDEKKKERVFNEVDDSGADEEGIERVVEANNTFAFELYGKLIQKEEGNIFYSPYSIVSALAMVYEGARAETAQEMQDVFHYPDYDLLRPNYAGLYNIINSDDTEYELRTGNALWVQDEFPFRDEYLSIVATYYGGKAEILDFKNKSSEARETINTYIEEQTEDKIRNIIPKGGLGSDTRLVLTNAIYFKGDWATQFDDEDTQEEDFTTLSGEVVQAPLMRRIDEEAEFHYAEIDEGQLLEMSYKGEELSMILFLPEEGRFEEIESAFLPDEGKKWQDALASSSPQEVDVFLPRFTFETKYEDIKNILQSMGLEKVFNGEVSDLSGMAHLTAQQRLFISKIIHQAFVEVNEEGTEAAAATVVGVSETSSIQPDPDPVFRADRPFLFMIQDTRTGAVLFMGRVADPTG